MMYEIEGMEGGLLEFVTSKADEKILFSSAVNNLQRLNLFDSYTGDLEHIIYETKYNFGSFNFIDNNKKVFFSIINSSEICSHFIYDLASEYVEEILISDTVTDGMCMENVYYYVDRNSSSDQNNVFKLDLNTGKIDQIYEGTSGVSSILNVSPYGESAIISQMYSSTTFKALFYHSENIIDLHSISKLSSIQSVDFLNEKECMILGREEKGSLCIFRYIYPDQITKLAEGIEDESYCVLYNSDLNKWVNVVRKGVVDKLYILGEDFKLEKVILDGFKGVIHDIQKVGKDYLVSTSSVKERKNIYRIRSSGKVEKITSFSLYESSIIPSIETFRSKDGTSIETLLYKNNEYDEAPVIIYLHGGPHAANRYQFSILPQILVSEGFHVMLPNFRGSTCYGELFEKEVYGDWSTKPSEDIKATINFARKLGLSQDKFILFGASYGGYLSLICAGKYPDLISGVISMGGPTDLEAFIKHVPSSWSSMMKEWFPSKNSRSMSPLHYIEQYSSSTLLIYGEDDIRVPYQAAVEFHDELIKKNIDSTFVKLSGTGHDFSIATSQISEACTSFLTEVIEKEQLN
ncbi:alpha/beta hydrolase family protein [Rossellomorea sp. LjRoot5]|uniref:alpha/beta hydrolase family protein n=1 Tax=Rossellomorea sp. LjRoot5 TaxID=3342331 RepID=UPI003ECC544D